MEQVCAAAVCALLICVQCVLEGYSEKIRAQVGEGCNLFGYIMVNKVAGNFHFAPGKSFQHSNMHVHDFMPAEMQVWSRGRCVYPGLTVCGCRRST